MKGSDGLSQEGMGNTPMPWKGLCASAFHHDTPPHCESFFFNPAERNQRLSPSVSDVLVLQVLVHLFLTFQFSKVNEINIGGRDWGKLEIGKEKKETFKP